MAESMVIAMGMVWILALVGGFFSIRGWRRRRLLKRQQKLAEAYHRASLSDRPQN